MPRLPKRLSAPSTARAIADPRRRTTTQRGYGYRWQKLRAAWLAAAPRLCVKCEADGFLVPAQDVDHIRPHGGDESLLYDWNNLQGLCHSHHSKKSRAEQLQGSMQ